MKAKANHKKRIIMEVNHKRRITMEVNHKKQRIEKTNHRKKITMETKHRRKMSRGTPRTMTKKDLKTMNKTLKGNQKTMKITLAQTKSN